MTLDRAGVRILEIGIESPAGDAGPENDRRFVTLHVARERVRVLHVAGQPTNDVRALRQWLKSDASVDVVAFFILRTPADQTMASQEDLALIPFPVDELFSIHLSSFDAVVLQDFDAQPYGLERHLPSLARYVRNGGGLIMVGGPNSFVAGGYAGTPLGQVLPVTLDGSPGATAADTAPFVPQWTEQGRAAPVLAPLRTILGDELPSMPGANVLGDVRPGGVVLWTHPTRATKSGAKMPVLAIGDQGDGRSSRGHRRRMDARVLRAGRAHRRARARRAVGRALGLADARSALRAGADRRGGRLHRRCAPHPARALGRRRRARGGDHARRHAHGSPGLTPHPRGEGAPRRGRRGRRPGAAFGGGRLFRAPARGARAHHPTGFRVRGGRQRVGRHAARSGAAARLGRRDLGHVRLRRRGAADRLPADRGQRRAPRDAARSALGLQPVRGDAPGTHWFVRRRGGLS